MRNDLQPVHRNHLPRQSVDADASRLVDARHLQRRDTRELAAELELNYKTVLTMRHRVQANAELEQPHTALPDSHSETDEMFHAKRAGEKAHGTRIPTTRLEDEPTNNADTGHMTMTVRPSLARWDAKAGKCAYAWFTILTEKHWKRMFISSP